MNVVLDTNILLRHTVGDDAKQAAIVRNLCTNPTRLVHPVFGRSASLQMLAIPSGIAVLCASHPIAEAGRTRSRRFVQRFPKDLFETASEIVIPTHVFREQGLRMGARSRCWSN
jgi:hypothetical protein